MIDRRVLDAANALGFDPERLRAALDLSHRGAPGEDGIPSITADRWALIVRLRDHPPHGNTPSYPEIGRMLGMAHSSVICGYKRAKRKGAQMA